METRLNRIKITDASGFTICENATQFAHHIAARYGIRGNKAELRALEKLWPRFLQLKLEPLNWETYSTE